MKQLRTINMNDHVTVRLTEYGVKQIVKYYADVGMVPMDNQKQTGVDIEFQLHELMAIFGKCMEAGFSSPFEKNILTYEEKND